MNTTSASSAQKRCVSLRLSTKNKTSLPPLTHHPLPPQNVHDIVLEAIENARFVCEQHYAMSKGPPIHLICPKDLTFPYVPGHLSHICFELLKNSLRAVVERYGTEHEDRIPPIKVVVVEGTEDITIKISDEGGGIPRSAIPLIWTYMYTTMERQSLDSNFQASNDFKAPMAGFGYGLPLSRLVRVVFLGPSRCSVFALG